MEEDSLKGLNDDYAVSRHEELPFPQSDIDMIVVAKDIPSDFFERAEFVRKIENCPSLLQSIWMNEEEFIGQFKAGAGYLLDAIHEGRIIYDTGFLKKIIPQARHELEAQGVKRIGNAWVWPVMRSKWIA